jgi:hypothetical protein
MTQTDNKRDHDFVVRLFAPHKVNEPWLENQAVKIEDALTGRFPEVPEPSVTANFEENGFELDLIIQAESLAEAYDKLGRVLEIVEETAGIQLGDGAEEVRSDYASAPDDDSDHDFMGLEPTPAC